MAGISAKFAEEYIGPTCLYELMAERLKRNPCLLQRNVLRPRLRANTIKKLSVQLQFSSWPVNGYVTFHVACKLEEDDKYTITYTGGYTPAADHNKAIKVNLPITDHLASPSCQHIFLLVLVSSGGHGKEAHDRWTNSICKAASENLHGKGRNEILEIQLPCHAIAMDLGCFITPSSPLLRNGFRTFMYPASTSAQHCALSKILRCRFNPNLHCSKKIKSAPVDENELLCELKFQTKSLPGDRRKLTIIRQPDSTLGDQIRPTIDSSETPSTTPTVVPKRGSSSCVLALCTGAVVYHCATFGDKGPSDSQAQGQGGEKHHRVWYEQREQIGCMWCSRKFSAFTANYDCDGTTSGDLAFRAGSLSAIHALAHHLTTFHDLFKYDFSLDGRGCLHVILHRASSRSPIPLAHQSHNHSRRPLPVLSCQVSLISPESERVMQHELYKLTKLATQQGSTRRQDSMMKMIGTNQFFHASTGQPMTKQDLAVYLHSSQNIDRIVSELDMNGYDLKERFALLDEYVDVSLQEKKFMKLWNAHVAAFPPYGDALLVLVCERFVQKHGMTLDQQKLRFNLLLHLISLWDFGLLTAEEVRYLILEVDKVRYNRVLDAATPL